MTVSISRRPTETHLGGRLMPVDAHWYHSLTLRAAHKLFVVSRVRVGSVVATRCGSSSSIGSLTVCLQVSCGTVLKARAPRISMGRPVGWRTRMVTGFLSGRRSGGLRCRDAIRGLDAGCLVLARCWLNSVAFRSPARLPGELPGDEQFRGRRRGDPRSAGRAGVGEAKRRRPGRVEVQLDCVAAGLADQRVDAC